MKICKRIADGILKAYAVLGVVALVLVIVATFLQVLTRYILPASLTWTEEGARYAFIWMSMLGAPLAARHCANASIDLLDSVFRGEAKKAHFVILQLLILAAAVLIFPFGVKMVGQMMMRRSSALGIPMGYVYLAIPIGCAGISISAIYNILERVFAKADSVPATQGSEG